MAALLEEDECPYPEQPIHLNVYVAGAFVRILFVENKTSFERCIRSAKDAFVHGRSSAYDETALVYSSGFMGSARRLRMPTASRVFYCFDQVSELEPLMRFNSTFFGDADVETMFWGDLDYAGMAILSRLRANFPSARAWEPGYAPMVAKLEAGEGHAPEEARKASQKPIEATGCIYADDVLIPALAKHGRFVDQE